MKVVFFGTPEYVLPVLDTLHKKLKGGNGESPIVAVVTQPPRPTGRNQFLEYSAVDTWAHKKHIPKFHSSQELFKENIVADIGVLASYGEIIPESIIKLFQHGILNIHPSLLPTFRGASPIQAAIISGDTTTGVSIIKMDAALDHGSIISQFKEEISDEDNSEILRIRLFNRAAEVITTLIPAYLAGKITPREQDHDKAIFTRQIKKEDAFIPAKILNSALTGVTPVNGKWKIPFIKDYSLVPSAYRQSRPSFAYSLDRFIRAMQPWPISWTYVQLGQRAKNSPSRRLFSEPGGSQNRRSRAVGKEHKRLKILKSHLASISDNSRKIRDVSEKSPDNTQEITKLILDVVQLEGKGGVSWKQFLEGYPEAKFI